MWPTGYTVCMGEGSGLLASCLFCSFCLSQLFQRYLYLFVHICLQLPVFLTAAASLVLCLSHRLLSRRCRHFQTRHLPRMNLLRSHTRMQPKRHKKLPPNDPIFYTIVASCFSLFHFPRRNKNTAQFNCMLHETHPN